MSSSRRRQQAYRASQPPGSSSEPTVSAHDAAETLELREEQLVPHKELRELGAIEISTEIEEVPGRLELDALREEVIVEHDPVGQVVTEREEPSESDGVLIVPVYEEQLIVVKRLVLRERMRIRRVSTTERQLFQDTLRRERLRVEDPQQTGLVHERYPTGPSSEEGEPIESDAGNDKEQGEGGFFGHLVRKALE